MATSWASREHSSLIPEALRVQTVLSAYREFLPLFLHLLCHLKAELYH